MNILSIGGSDPSAGAGIQNDIKTISSLGGYCFTVITCVTSQNTKKFFSVEPVSPNTITKQIESILSDFNIDAVKIGMVYHSPIIRAIHQKLKKLDVQIILDPVIKSTTGGMLITPDSLSIYKKTLMPIGFVITPNKSEAEILSGIKIKTKKDAINCSKRLRKYGVKNIVITGIEFSKGVISDFIQDGKTSHVISARKLTTKNHGSGCTFSSTIAFCIANKNNILDAVKFAKNYTVDSIKNAEKLGKGVSITRIKKNDLLQAQLKSAIIKFTQIKNIHDLIPEVQSNFVFAKNQPKSINDIAGVTGRIVKVGKTVEAVGNLEYGGSRHVGTAVLIVSKKFSKIRSAVNIKFDEKTIKKFQKMNFKILSYDRNDEPVKKKIKENQTISWGIKNAIKSSSVSPDVIFHKGDLGKEPMILVFGRDPNEVVQKILKLN